MVVVQVVALTAFVLFAPLPVLVRMPEVEPARAAPLVERPGPGDPVEIGGPGRARAIYGYLAPGETADTFVFTAPRDAEERLALYVPDGGGAGAPHFVLVDPEEPDVLEPDPAEPDEERVFEPLTLQVMQPGARSRARLVAGRRYFMRVVPGEDGYRGPYVLTLTGPTDFSFAQQAEAAVRLPLIWLGLYGQSPFRFAALGRLVLAAMVTAAAVACAALGRRSSAA